MKVSIIISCPCLLLKHYESVAAAKVSMEGEEMKYDNTQPRPSVRLFPSPSPSTTPKHTHTAGRLGRWGEPVFKHLHCNKTSQQLLQPSPGYYQCLHGGTPYLNLSTSASSTRKSLFCTSLWIFRISSSSCCLCFAVLSFSGKQDDKQKCNEWRKEGEVLLFVWLVLKLRHSIRNTYK